MFTIVVTGGLAAGKTTANEYFRSRGAVVIDLDSVGHRLLAPGTDVHRRLVETFGDGILDESGTIDRASLAAAAFRSYETAMRLNSIVHPAIAAEVLPGLTEMGLLQNPPPLVVVDVPLLVEAPVYAEMADIVLAISAPEESRIARAVARGMAEGDARARMGSQATDMQRAAMADYEIVNDSTLEDFRAALARFWHEVVEGAA